MNAVSELIATQRVIGPDRGDPRRVVCGDEYVCALQLVENPNPALNFDAYPYCTGRVESRLTGAPSHTHMHMHTHACAHTHVHALAASRVD